MHERRNNLNKGSYDQRKPGPVKSAQPKVLPQFESEIIRFLQLPADPLSVRQLGERGLALSVYY